jgi:hypothetical protein
MQPISWIWAFLVSRALRFSRVRLLVLSECFVVLNRLCFGPFRGGDLDGYTIC